MEPNLTKVIVSQVDAPPICVLKNTLAATNSSHLPGSYPKRKRSSSHHPFSGANC